MREPWPALGPQWFAWSDDWGELLGHTGVRSVAAQGTRWAWGVPDQEPAGEPPMLMLPGATVLWTHRQLRGDLFDALENFLDPMHTPFVHAGLVRSEGEREAVAVEVRGDGETVSATYRRARKSGVLRRVFGAGIDRTVGRYRPPGVVELDYFAGERHRLRIVLAFTPTREGWLGLSAGLVAPLNRVVATVGGVAMAPLLELALRQDLEIIAAKAEHEDRWFPERRYVHTSADLLGPQLLRWLKTGKLGVVEKIVEVWL